MHEAMDFLRLLYDFKAGFSNIFVSAIESLWTIKIQQRLSNTRNSAFIIYGFLTWHLGLYTCIFGLISDELWWPSNQRAALESLGLSFSLHLQYRRALRQRYKWWHIQCRVDLSSDLCTPALLYPKFFKVTIPYLKSSGCTWLTRVRSIRDLHDTSLANFACFYIRVFFKAF